MRIVAKFGGTSVGSCDAIRRTKEILDANPNRTICVVSAPGRAGNDAKVTDLLMRSQFGEVLRRFGTIIDGLELPQTLKGYARKKLTASIRAGYKDAIFAFGEYMNARIIAEFTGRRFIDATEVIFFNGDDVIALQAWDDAEAVVVPGFYGYDLKERRIRIFPRGGSDISASYIAQMIGAKLYENWTDVSGVFDRDPKKYPDAVRYDYLSYEEIGRIAKSGAQVFHPDAVKPAREARIPILIRNTFCVQEPGTLIL